MVLLQKVVKNLFSYSKKQQLKVFKNVALRSFSSFKPLVDISDPAVVRYLNYIKEDYWILKTKPNLSREEINKLKFYLPLVKIIEERSCVLDNLNNLSELSGEETKDKDMLELVKEETETYNSILSEMDHKLTEVLLSNDTKYSASDTILEILPGVGGQEAMLFAKELFNMYVEFANYKKWHCNVTSFDTSDIGGLKKASLLLSGIGTYETLKYEGGVHRVQRIPSTEKGGRLHTSTASIAVLLQPTEIEVVIPDRDVRIETKRSTGAGGQHVNTTDSAVRVVHIPSGLAVECQTERDQHQNKKNALARLRALLYQQQQDKQEMEERANRKAQLGSGLRNEKIRTYNYNQDRVTDHRLGASAGTVHELDKFMEGGAALDDLIRRLKNSLHTQTVLQQIEEFRNNDRTNSVKQK